MYYFDKVLPVDMDTAIDRVTAALAKEGFGILTRIDVHKKFKEKLNVDFRRYVILGACNPAYAHKALKMENKIGTMLPCNVVIQELGPQKTEVAAVNPLESMRAIDNPALAVVAHAIQAKLKAMIETL